MGHQKPSEYRSSATALIMKSGNFFVNYHGFCLFVNKRFIYLAWVKTKEYGLLPPTQEYGRLRQCCDQFTLTKEQEAKVWPIVQQLVKSPYYGLTRLETITAQIGKRKRDADKPKKNMVVVKKQKTRKQFVCHSFSEIKLHATG